MTRRPRGSPARDLKNPAAAMKKHPATSRIGAKKGRGTKENEAPTAAAAAATTTSKEVLLEGAGDEASIAPSARYCHPSCAADARFERCSGRAQERIGSRRADDEEDDTRQLHELLLLARRPYCRANGTFTGRNCDPLSPFAR
jgi:hypothetical protein